MSDISKDSDASFFFIIEQVALELRMLILLICLKQNQPCTACICCLIKTLK